MWCWCTWTLGLQESLYTLSNKFGNDWITLWSLNTGNPDSTRSGRSVYYAHPYTLQRGESVTTVRARFGITAAHVARLNNNVTNFGVGDTMCVSLDWTRAVDWEGRLVCRAAEERLAALDDQGAAGT